jgi:hypothetical protein
MTTILDQIVESDAPKNLKYYLNRNYRIARKAWKDTSVSGIHK